MSDHTPEPNGIDPKELYEAWTESDLTLGQVANTYGITRDEAEEIVNKYTHKKSLERAEKNKIAYDSTYGEGINPESVKLLHEVVRLFYCDYELARQLREKLGMEGHKVYKLADEALLKAMEKS